MPGNSKTVALDPAVLTYVSTDLSLDTILRGENIPDRPILQALRLIQECLHGKRLARDAISAAEAVPLEGESSELVIMLLTGWAELACRINRPSEAQALLHRADALITDATHPEMRAGAMLVNSILADTTGDKNQREAILRAILRLLPGSSPRRKFYAWELALALARQGRLNEEEAALRMLETECNERFSPSRIHLVRFLDRVETGRALEAVALRDLIESDPGVVRTFARALYVGHRALLDLMLQARQTAPAASAELPPGRAFAWLRVVSRLQAGDTAEALRLARIEADRVLGSIFGSGFDSLNLVRAELAAGHGEAARRLLRMRHARGNRHYLDDFFMARIERLAGHTDEAAQCFADTLRAAEERNAAGRIDFELRLAGELSPFELVDLTRAADRLRRRSRRRTPPPSEPREPDMRTAAHGRGGTEDIVGHSPATASIREMVRRFADADLPVLITGETGTGKERVARALHDISKRRDQPFIAVNCGSIGESLLESELFGHKRGAFTGAETENKGLFEEAGAGTILLDEMGDILPRLQGALLRVLETGEIRAVGSTKTRGIRCRILAATNKDLNRLADENSFRKDLLFRLQRLGIYIPPLRDRRQDILPLCRHFLDAGRPGGQHARLSADLVDALESYDWPGNVRELRNVIERMRLMHSDKLDYSRGDLDLRFQTGHAPTEENEAEPASARRPTRIPIELAARRSVTPRLPGGIPPPQRPAPPAAGAAGTPPDLGVDLILHNGSSRIRRLDRLRGLFRTYRKLTRHEVVSILGIAPNTATTDLGVLIQEGLIRRVEPSASTRSHYFEMAEDARPGVTPKTA